MAAATIVLEDAPDGTVAFKLTFSSTKGGYDGTSGAHRTAHHVLKTIDDEQKFMGEGLGPDNQPTILDGSGKGLAANN